MTDPTPDPPPAASDPRRARDARTGDPAAAARIAQQTTWVDLQIRQAMERGEFDNLPGAGKPLDLGDQHDPDWWLKRLIQREHIAVLPASLQLRADDAALDGRLDELVRDDDVRREVDEFNRRVLRARYLPAEGPPLITQPRDADEAVAAWSARREERRRAHAATAREAAVPVRRSWWRRLLRGRAAQAQRPSP